MFANAGKSPQSIDQYIISSNLLNYKKNIAKLNIDNW